ncbi:MAG: hypothetical protein IPM98_04400 [Lewinellaceae bacterium]|nr:hypothetical protein [Lewinellaceae bacterium]
MLQNFTPAQYYDKGKIWDIRAAPNGIIYMAADKGLLEYDGRTWNSFKGSKGFTRSLLVLNDSLIYTGSDLDFGVWRKNNYQKFEYTSLYPFQEVVQEVNEEFWKIHRQRDDIVFVSSQNIYVHKDRQLIRIAAPHRIANSFSVNGILYFADEKLGLYIFDGFALKKVFEYPQNTKFHISGIYEDARGLVLATRDAGLYRYASGSLNRLDNALSEELKVAKVFNFEPIGQLYLAFGTVLKGLYIADLDGNIIHHVNKYKGLSSNTVLCLHYSPSGKLWLGMDYGVAALNLKSRFTTFYDYRGDFGAGYTALLKDGDFYLGTNQGLYCCRWEDLNDNLEFFRFQLIRGTEGQVWSLENIDNSLLMGHDKGLFLLKGNTVEKLNGQDGAWTILPYKDYLLTGNYNGISIFKKSGAAWKFLKKMDLIAGSCNQIILENDSILWINIPNFGIIRAVLDKDLYPADRLIFPEATFEGNDPFLLKDEQGVHLATDQFQYTFNAAERKFIQKEIPANASSGAGELLSRVYQSRALHPDYAFYPASNGFLLKHLKSTAGITQDRFSIVFRGIEAFNNDQRVAVEPEMKVPYSLNNFEIKYIVPGYDDVVYQYKLNDSDHWSPWVSENSTKLIDLNVGTHTLLVRAKIQDTVTGFSPISFRVAPPWYLSWLAFLSYLILLSSAVYAIHYWKKQSLKKQQDKLLQRKQDALREQAEQHKQEILSLEQERLQAEYNQLKKNLRSKTIELAKQARENEEKNRLLLSLKEKCAMAQENPSLFKMKWKEMERLLESYIKAEDQIFEIQIDELHQEFFKKLKTKFQSLSNHDLRMCAYLKIGIDSKEIAEILHIQPSSFYISRSRLRKKLELKADENLYDFLNSV